MRNLNVSKIKGKGHSSSITVSKPKKGTVVDVTAANYRLKLTENYSASIKVIPQKDFSFKQEAKI